MLAAGPDGVYFYDGPKQGVRKLSFDLEREDAVSTHVVCSPLAVSTRVVCAQVGGLFELPTSGGTPRFLAAERAGPITATATTDHRAYGPQPPDARRSRPRSSRTGPRAGRPHPESAQAGPSAPTNTHTGPPPVGQSVSTPLQPTAASEQRRCGSRGRERGALPARSPKKIAHSLLTSRASALYPRDFIAAVGGGTRWPSGSRWRGKAGGGNCEVSADDDTHTSYKSRESSGSAVETCCAQAWLPPAWS
jgi:hypothetical protein